MGFGAGNGMRLLRYDAGSVHGASVSYDQKPYRRILMETYGASVHSSPTRRTHAGRAILKQHPDHPGTLGVAISEAVEMAASPTVKASTAWARS